jgi:Na+/H+ antiporter NhaD/arsenite permease-like protein
MSELQIYIVVGVFAAVILVIAFDVIDMAVAALLGMSALIALRILSEEDLLAAARISAGPICRASNKMRTRSLIRIVAPQAGTSPRRSG